MTNKEKLDFVKSKVLEYYPVADSSNSRKVENMKAKYTLAIIMQRLGFGAESIRKELGYANTSSVTNIISNRLYQTKEIENVIDTISDYFVEIPKIQVLKLMESLGIESKIEIINKFIKYDN